MNILQAIADEKIFRPFFGEDLSTWQSWNVALRCLYGLPIKRAASKELVQQCTGRNASELPTQGFTTAVLLVGRRSGKSKISAVIGGFEALFGGHDAKLAKGETGLVPIISPTRQQSSYVWKYLHALFSTPLLKQEIVAERELEKILVLRNGLEIRILTGDHRSVRGPAVVCAIVDEACFFHLADEGKLRSMDELARALRPALITTQGKLVAISSKYSRRGWCHSQWLRQHGANKDSPSYVQTWRTLCWDSPSKRMNPCLPQSEIDAAYAEDPAAARSEFGGEWRDDVAAFIERSVVENLVIRGRKELLPRSGVNYFAFSDLSGGRSDAAALAIAHKEGRKVVLDFLRIWKAPFNPHVAVSEQADELRRFGLRRVTGDNYAAEFVAQAFLAQGIHYVKSDQNKSELYRELLPRLCSAEIELLDSEVLINELCSLERRTRSGGSDQIDSPKGLHDDAANAVAGVAVCASARARVIGPLFKPEPRAAGALALGLDLM